jgi:hypothetical protein
VYSRGVFLVLIDFFCCGFSQAAGAARRSDYYYDYDYYDYYYYYHYYYYCQAAVLGRSSELLRSDA